MLARIRTAALWGLEAFPIECEIDVGPGLPGFILVGLPDASAREAKDRIWPTLRNSGFKVPDRRVTANLAPAERRKEGASADLAIAIGILCATNQAPSVRLRDPDMFLTSIESSPGRANALPGSRLTARHFGRGSSVCFETLDSARLSQYHVDMCARALTFN